MSWFITALSGVILSACILVVFLFLLRFPRKLYSLGPFKFQGILSYWSTTLLPKQLNSWLRLAKPSQQIRMKLSTPKTQEIVITWLTDQVNDYLTNTLPQKWPMLSLLVGDKTQEKVRVALTEYVHENWGKTIEGICSKQLTDERIISAVQSEITEKYATIIYDQMWAYLKKQSFRWAPLFLFLGALSAMVGRLIYQTFTSF